MFVKDVCWHGYVRNDLYQLIPGSHLKVGGQDLGNF